MIHQSNYCLFFSGEFSNICGGFISFIQRRTRAEKTKDIMYLPTELKENSSQALKQLVSNYV